MSCGSSSPAFRCEIQSLVLTIFVPRFPTTNPRPRIVYPFSILPPPCPVLLPTYLHGQFLFIMSNVATWAFCCSATFNFDERVLPIWFSILPIAVLAATSDSTISELEYVGQTTNLPAKNTAAQVHVAPSHSRRRHNVRHFSLCHAPKTGPPHLLLGIMSGTLLWVLSGTSSFLRL